MNEERSTAPAIDDGVERLRGERRDAVDLIRRSGGGAMFERSPGTLGGSELGESKESEAKYRGLLEAAPDAMVVVNQSGEIVLLNLQAETQFGYHRDELVGQQVRAIIPEGFAERLLADDLRSAEDALAQQIGTGIELTGRRKDGSEFPIEIMLSPLKSAEGILVTAAIRNISVRKAAEQHLAQMEGRYRGLLEAAPDAMVVVNPSGEIVLLNMQAEKRFGYHRDELVGQKVSNIIPEGFSERLIADALRSAEDAQAQQMGTGIELTGRRKDGSEFPIEIMLSPLDSAEGVLVTAAIRDISVRKAAEQHLAQMEGRYRGLLEAAPDAMVVVNPGGEIVLLNVQAEKRFGYHRDELLGQQVQNIIPEGFAERLIADALRSAEDALAQQIGTGIELSGRRKDGSEFPIEIMLSPLESADGLLVTAAIRDITARKQLEQELVHAQRMEGVGQLAGGIAHDFNNLLTVISGQSQLALDRLAAADPLRRRLDLILKTSARAAALTRQLLAFSRKQVLQPKVLDLNELVAQSTSLLERLIGEHIELTFVPGADAGRVRVDPGQLEQVIVNLAVNARDAMPEGGRLTVETANVALPADYAALRVGVAPGSYVMLAVSDTGVGMDRGVQARIFEPFFTTKGPGRGTGLGLATVYGIVKQSGGHIRVYSEPGRGTAFKIYLPRTDAPAEPASAAAPGAPPRGRETVLLVEDEHEVRGLAREVLEGLGYTVLEAAVPSDAFLLAERHAGLIDLLLTDVVMPGMSGRALASRVTAERPETKVLFMSGYTDDAIVRHGVLESGTSFLEKPFTPQALAVKVRETLDR